MLHFNPTCVADFLCSTRAFARKEFPSLVSKDQQCVLAPFMRCAKTKLRNHPMIGEIAMSKLTTMTKDLPAISSIGIRIFVNKERVVLRLTHANASQRTKEFPLWDLYVHSKKNTL